MRFPVDGTWRYNATTKTLTWNGHVIKFSYYSPRPSGIHRAVDITPLASGSYVHALYSSRVSRLGYDSSGWGRYERLKDSAGHEVLYAHLHSYSSGTTVGKSWAEGAVCARSDNTGNTTGPHLHVEYWWVAGNRATSIDPWQLLIRKAKGSALVAFPYPTPTWSHNYRQGNTGTAVMAIQWALADWRVDGIFDSSLTSKVKAFQKAHGIPQSGVVGTRTGPLLARVKR